MQSKTNLYMLKNKKCLIKKETYSSCTVITAGSNYLDIDAYACIVAMTELMLLKGQNVLGYSKAPFNYSICDFLVNNGNLTNELPYDRVSDKARYIIVDVSDPDFLESSVPLEKVAEIYDHHTGFEDYWTSCIGSGAHIEFIGAAATLIYREWKKAGLQDKMSVSSARLLIAAILDNTLNLTSSNTTTEDVEAFDALCAHAGVGDAFRAEYFSRVQANVEADLKNALINDMKNIGQNPVLPGKIFQLCVWNAEKMLTRLSEIRTWFGDTGEEWMLNLIDIKHRCSYFVCYDRFKQKNIEKIFNVIFEQGIARSDTPYLRKQILKSAFDFK